MNFPQANPSSKAASLLVVLACNLPLIGCETKSSTPVPDASTHDATTMDASDAVVHDAGSDAAVYPRDLPCEEPCLVRYRELEPFDVPVDHHTSFVMERQDGFYLYVVGGIEAASDGDQAIAVNRRVSAAKIQDDGSLGAWEHSAMPDNIGFAYHAQRMGGGDKTTNQVVYFGSGLAWRGGDAPNDPSGNRQLFGLIFAPGTGPGFDAFHSESLGSLARAALPDAPLLHSTLVFSVGSTGGWFHYLGGTKLSSQGGPTDEVWSLEGAGNASLVRGAALPETRSHHASIVATNRRIYVMGGFGGTAENEPRDAVLAARLGDGVIVGWDRVGTLEDPPWTASTFENNGYVYLVGGGHEQGDMHNHGGHDAAIADASIGDANIADASIADAGHTHGHIYQGGEPGFDGNPFIARVRRARIEADGSLSVFEDVNPLPLRRSHVHQTPMHRNFFYSVGGRTFLGNSVKTTNRVFVGEIQ